MSENYIVINGKKAELTQEQLEALGIEVKKPNNPFEMGEEDSEYYFINSWGCTVKATMCKENSSDLRHRVANYCTDESLLLQQAYRETLNRLLWRFSMEHDGDKIDWANGNTNKHYIFYGHNDKTWKIDCNQYYQRFAIVYFNSGKIAEQAIEEVVKPFMASHPDFKL